MRKIVVGIMGPGRGATPADLDCARALGRRVAEAGWVLLSGGRNVGVMDAASRGAKTAGGLTIGILPGGDDRGISEAVDIAIATDMGNARNNINVLSSDAIVACGMGIGTLSEIALALKAGKPVVLVNWDEKSRGFLAGLVQKNHLFFASDPEEAIAMVRKLLGRSPRSHSQAP